MPPRCRRSVVHLTLARIAIGSGVLMIVGGVITVLLMFRAIEARVQTHLDQYVVERATREEARFSQICDNLMIAAQAFQERFAQPDPPGYLDRWDELFARFPDGAWRSPREVADGSKDTTLWAHKDVVLTDELKRRTLVLYDTLEKFRPAWIGTFRSLWACTPEMTNLGFDPLIANWVYDTPADWDQNSVEWVAVATPERNPERKIVWTSSIIEDISKEYFVSVCLPIYVDDRHVATIGHDMRVLRLIERGVETHVQGMTHMMVRNDGRIIAHPDKREEIMASNGTYAMSDDPQLASLFELVKNRRETHFTGYDPKTGLYFAVSRLPSPGWLFLTTMPRSILMADAFSHARWVLVSGVACIVVLLGYLAISLRRNVALPLAALTQATESLSEGAPGNELTVMRDDELGQLAAAFNRMASKVAERDAALRQLNSDLEARIAERTAELQTSEARVRAMLENTPEAIVVLDADTGRFVTGNENAVRFFGVDRETLQQLRPADLSPPLQPDGRPSDLVAREHIAVALGGETTVFEWMHRRQDGSDLPCEVRLSRLPSGSRDLLIGTITDISERKQAEARLLEALEHERELSEMKSGFVAMVSHEFRTPLGIISSSAEILRRYFERLSPENRDEHLDTIVRSTRQLAVLIDEVLLLGRFESGRVHFAAKPVDLAVLCHNFADEVASATNHTSPIEVRVARDAVDGASDEVLLRHIFSNLLSNAVKYSPPGATVTFTLERDGNYGVFRVRDQGIGIPPEDMRLLFTAFRRGRNVGARPGTGLGLVIVKRCVELHGGELQLESEPGQGTCAIVRLPVYGLRVPIVGAAVDPSSGTEPATPRE